MKRLLIIIAIVFIVIQSLFAQSPNFIIILTDDQSWNDLPFPISQMVPAEHWSNISTPHIENLAKSGITFTNAYAPSPNCTPSRRSIQFGQDPARLRGTEFVSKGIEKSDFTSIPEALASVNKNYITAHFGKWGEAMVGDWNETFKGHPVNIFKYDQSDGTTGNHTGTYYHQNSDQFDSNFKLSPDNDPKRVFSIAQKAKKFIGEAHLSNRPFFMQLSYYSIHTAYEALPQTIEDFQYKQVPEEVPSAVYAMLKDMDTSIGMVFDYLKELGLYENTYIILTSDNGGAGWRDDFGVGRNMPLRGFKNTVLEGGIRIPFLLSGPNVAKDIRNEGVISQIDIFPTILELAGGNRENVKQELVGKNIFEIVNDENQSRELFWHQPYNSRYPSSAYRKGKFKLLVHWNRSHKKGRYELFNLEEDISESKDLAHSHKNLAKRLYNELCTYLIDVKAEVPYKIDLHKELKNSTPKPVAVPNPANGDFKIYLNNPGQVIKKVLIFDSVGRTTPAKIWMGMEQERHYILIEKLNQPGIYNVVVQTNHSKNSVKVIIQR